MKISTAIALDWAIRCFGRDHVFNRPMRALRLAEEAIELAQAFGVSKHTILTLVDVVYGRPPGNPEQEIGGVAMTAEVMAATFDADLDSFFNAELRRVLQKSREHFAQRNQDKVDLGLTA